MKEGEMHIDKAAEPSEIAYQIRTCDGSDKGDFFGDLFTLKVLLRGYKKIHRQTLESIIICI